MEFLLTSVKFRTVVRSDLSSIAEIYNQGIQTRISTFDESFVSGDRYEKYLNLSNLAFGMVVAEYEGQVIGWSSFEPKSDRLAYRFTCLGSTYIRDGFRGQELGGPLINEKLDLARRMGYHSVVGEILSTNVHSLRLCYSLGYDLVGEIKEAGYRNNRWIGLVIIQRMLS